MHIISLALGGCLKGEPVRYGITEDTGGHITYILGEMQALAQRDDVDCAEIVTRRFDDPALGAIHMQAEEWLGPKLLIRRIDSGNLNYLSKDALCADRAAFTRALIADLRSRARLPDLIHAHFADAADVAAQVQEELGIPFIYTAHSLGLDKREALDVPSAAIEARIAEEDRAIARAAAIVGSSRDECERQIMAYPSADVGRVHRLVPGSSRPAADDHRAEAAALTAPFLRDPGKPVILAIARAVHKKNLVRLVEAFGGSPRLRGACNLVVLAGLRDDLRSSEPEQVAVLSDLVDAIDRHDLYGSVAYPKNHSRTEVTGLYQLATDSGGVFVNPALIEPYGLTLVEAASHGLPVVATKIGGPLDILDDLEHGLLIDPHDAAELAGAIERLVEDREFWQRCSDRGRTRSRAMNWDAYAEGLVRIARGIVEPEAPRVEAPGRLVVSDLDNTLTGCEHGAVRFSGFFRRRTEFGFIVATGRSIVEAQRLVRDWKLPAPLAWITSVGSEIYHRTPGGVELDEHYARRIARDWDAQAVERIMNSIPGLTPQATYEQRPFKRSYFAEDRSLFEEAGYHLRKAGIRARVVFSHQRLLDILPIDAGKAAAMRHVAAHFGIAADQVFAAGDSGNDIDMLSECDNAILVGNHADEVASLVEFPNVYRARRHHGAGALEGVLAHWRANRPHENVRAGDAA